VHIDRESYHITAQAFYVFYIPARVLCELYLMRIAYLKPAGKIHPAAERRLGKAGSCCQEQKEYGYQLSHFGVLNNQHR
jgi:hypothetical protein